jgi:hypothetical protein
VTLAGEAREHIFQLREFHLQTSFGRAGAMGEYIEDQLSAVDDLDVNCVFEIALLRWRELVVDNQDIGLMRFRKFFQLPDFSLAEQSSGVKDGADLKYFGCVAGAGSCGQFGKLTKRFGRSRGRRSPAAFEAGENRLLRLLLE